MNQHIKIEFPVKCSDVARAFSEALAQIGAQPTQPDKNHEVYEDRSLTEYQFGLLDDEAKAKYREHLLKNIAKAFNVPLDLVVEAAKTGKSPEIQLAETVSGDETVDIKTVSIPPAKTVTLTPLKDDKVDTKGVPFDAQYCSQAAIPFYSSGARKGQWKKKKNVDDADYDTWYEGSLPTAVATPKETRVNTSEAFGGESAETTGLDIPTDCGTFMVWASSYQAAGRLSQQQITGAYEQAGLAVASLFPPKTPEEIQANVALLVNILAPMVAAQ